jgi:hypothetical protein
MNECDENLNWKDKLILSAAALWCLMFIGLSIIGAVQAVKFTGWM